MQEFIGWPCQIHFIGESCGTDEPEPPGDVVIGRRSILSTAPIIHECRYLPLF